MTSAARSPSPTAPARWWGALVIGLALVVLGGTVVWAALDLRARIQAQVVQREAEVLDAVAQMQRLNDETAGETLATLAEPGEQFQLALKVSRLREVIGVRLYGADGKIVNAFPAYITEAPLPDGALPRLQALGPVGSFSPRSAMAEQDLLAESNSPPAALLFVEVPLRVGAPPRLAGIMQLVMDGSRLAGQYAELDRHLALKFGAAFGVGALILSVGLGLALRRVELARRKLAERTANLLQANRELSLAARTSAVGAVASHLIHGLKNPLSGLRQFVHLHHTQPGQGPDTDWQAALGTTQRMEELINRVVRVLQEQQTGVVYELSLKELAGLVEPKARALAEAKSVRFTAQIEVDGVLSNRDADLILLILENLVNNAIEATPAGRQVGLRVQAAPAVWQFEVWDQGPGLPPRVVERLFQPGPSTKPGGAGIGLAISKQLAQTLGASLELASSDGSGTIFRLVFLPSSGHVFPHNQNGNIPAHIGRG